MMLRGNTKAVRREVLLLLYARYQADPMHSLMPSELYVELGLGPEEITPAAFYLHERGLVDLMVGFTPPNFDAVRISTSGIDLVEDASTFDRQFPSDEPVDEAHQAEITPLFLTLLQQVEACSLSESGKSWLVEDLRALRDSLRRPLSAWNADEIRRLQRNVDDYLDESLRRELSAMDRLRDLIDAELDEAD